MDELFKDEKGQAVPPWKPCHETMPPMVPNASKGYPYAMRAQPLYVSGLCQILTEVFNRSIYIYTHRRRVYIYIVCFCADMLVTHINIYTHTQTHTTHTCLHPYVPTHLPIPTYLYIPTYKYQPTCTGTPRHDTFTHHID